MKAKILFLPLFLFSMLISSCTHNDGDIGEYFGEWQLTQLSVDGLDIKLYGDGAESKDPDFGSPLAYTIAFQGDVARINILYAYHEIISIFGSWQLSDGNLILNFSHTDDVNPDEIYRVPDILGFPIDGIVVMKVVKINDKKMELRQTSDAGNVFKYYFKKRS